MQYVTLNNGISMPQLGFGVWKIDNEKTASIVDKAFKVGYRSIDTASAYGNEQGVGKAIAQSGLPREELFITTKVWNGDQGYNQTLAAFNKSMEALKLDYIDLYLIHWPTPKYDNYVDTYKALETLYHEGRVKSIGVSNFNQEHLERIFAECDIKPVVNQVECHPYFQQAELKSFCNQHDIYIESYSPLDRGNVVLKDTVITELANKHNKTPAQIILRWHLQENCIVIPKSETPSRIEENFSVFDFELSASDMKQITGINRNERRGSEPSENNAR